MATFQGPTTHLVLYYSISFFSSILITKQILLLSPFSRFKGDWGSESTLLAQVHKEKSITQTNQ